MAQFSKAEITRRLVELRNHLAERERKEKFKILQNKTIEGIVHAMPRTLAELEMVKGMGVKKIAKFGAQILEALHPVREKSPQATEVVLPWRTAFSNGVHGAGLGEGPETAEAPTARSISSGQAEDVFTVSRFLDRVNAVLATERDLFVQGEVSSIQVLPSGAYFTLKDKEDESVLSCYMNPRAYHALGFLVEAGMEAKVGGVLNVYKPKGRLSFVVYTLTLAGEGSLKKAYELLKKKLEAEGLFARKRPLPEFISRVGVITSRTGAVIDDFRKNLAPLGLRLFLYDARVEGARAVPEIIKGIDWFNVNAPDLDVLVVIRGGGSLEDLQAFDNENVARAVFASKISTICSIGHHRDVTIASLVGDAETSTPSIAAMLINKSWDRLREEAPLREQDLLHAEEGALETLHARAESSTQSLMRFFERLFYRAEAFKSRFAAEFRRLVTRRGEFEERGGELVHLALERLLRLIREQAGRLGQFEAYLQSNDPERNLRLGYSILLSSSGKVVKAPEDITIGEEVVLRINRGEVDAKVERIRKNDEG
ncbi:MAG: exodeoxyribonuclease VII large subunit [bacterium]|nr:exodeoxyribonuclease VII large subunit [bacterium]